MAKLAPACGAMRALSSALLALLACVLASGAASCAPTPPAPDPALWRIADADSEIWLFGTVHVLPPELKWRGPRFEAAFAAAEELVTETEIADDAAFAALNARYGVLPPGQTLANLLDAQTLTRLQRVARSVGDDPAALQNLRPWLAALRLSFCYARREGQVPEAGVEALLLPEARARGMTLTLLETPEQQIRTLADLAPADELRFLIASLRQIEEEDDDLAATDSAWARGDTAALAALTEPQLREAGPAAYAALITNRNRAWANEIARRLEGDGRIFVAVGAAHLVGPDSVVAMLRARGVSVEGP